MSNPNIDDTVPIKIPSNEHEPQASSDHKPRRWPWVLAGILLIIVIGGAGVGLGYNSAIQNRIQKQSNLIALGATTQFQLGQQDLEAGRLEMARKRFEYIIQIDPNFPGATEKLAEVMLAMALLSTPIEEVPQAPTSTPTPDLRGVEEIFNHAQQLMRNQEWSAAVDLLDVLRKEDVTYRAIEVDGLYYTSLRYRGLDKIINKGNLEGGIYDLALVERFGPLDHEADGFRNWARYYITGASFWEIDWLQVINYFGQVYQSLPNLRDGSGWTATERFRVASIRYGDQLILEEQYCSARDQYSIALSISQDNQLAPTATKAQLLCAPPTATPMPPTTTPMPPTDTPVPTATGEGGGNGED